MQLPWEDGNFPNPTSNFCASTEHVLSFQNTYSLLVTVPLVCVKYLAKGLCLRALPASVVL